MTTTSNKISSLRKRATLLMLMMMMMVAGTLFAAPSLSMAQQTNTGTATVTTPPPLTPEEQRQQDRLQSIMAATTRNLIQGQKQIDGLVYTPRYSNPVWVEPDSLSIVFVYCLPGEFADSGQEILGGSDLEVLESYSLAVTNDLTGWLIVVENENENARLPAAVGVICSSDANDPEARILSQQEQVEINNIIRQFITVRNTVINNVTQVINIINNVTRPPPTNNTGGGGGNTTEPLTVQAVIDIDQDASPVVGFETLTDGGTPPYTCHWDLGDGTTTDTCGASHIYQNPGTYTATVTVTDSVGQTASDSTEEFSITNTGGGNTTEPLTVQAKLADIDQDASPVVGFETLTDGGTPPYTCLWDLGDGTTSDTCGASHIYQNPGTYTATVTVTDSVGQTASDSTEEFSITNTGGGENNPITVEELPVDEPPPTNDTGGQ